LISIYSPNGKEGIMKSWSIALDSLQVRDLLSPSNLFLSPTPNTCIGWFCLSGEGLEDDEPLLLLSVFDPDLAGDFLANGSLANKGYAILEV
jgi:hypothetical protein